MSEINTSMTKAMVIETRRNKFITDRAKWEVEFKTWLTEVMKADHKLFDGIEFPNPPELKTLIPELYEKYPSQEKYDAQFQAYTTFVGKINAIADRLIEEASKCLQESKELNLIQ